MKFKTYLKNRYFIGLMCIVLALVLSLFIIPSQNEKESEPVEVVRVKSKTATGTVITKEMLVTVSIPRKYVAKNVITKENVNEIIGYYAQTDLFPEDNLLKSKLSSTEISTDKFLYDIMQEGKYAVSVSVKSLAAGVSGKIQTGDVVAVYGFKNQDNEKTLIAYPELANVEVGTVSNAKGTAVDTKSEDENERIPATATFIVDDNQAQKLIELENTSNIHIVYKARGKKARELLGKPIEEASSLNSVSAENNLAAVITDSPQTAEKNKETSAQPQPQKDTPPQTEKRDESNLDDNFSLN